MNNEKTKTTKPGAIFHFSCKVHGKSNGSNAVKLAAYRSGSRLRSELTGRIHNYSRKKEVLWSQIMAPGNAPAWVFDRSKLWNTVDRIETRRNAQLAREVEVALPLALSPTEHCELLRKWLGETFISLGMVADVCYHAKSGNPHAHVLLTLREIDTDGFSKKNRGWNYPNLVEAWRASWAKMVNEYLEKAGLGIRIDHRSFKRQGLDLTPTKHLGRETPFNCERIAEVSLENRLIEIEQDISCVRRACQTAEKQAATQSPTATVSPPTPSLPRMRRRRPTRPQPPPVFTPGTEPSF